jgi:hypothetical protein
MRKHVVLLIPPAMAAAVLVAPTTSASAVAAPAPAAAAAPGTYDASAHGDLLDLATLKALGQSIATLKVGHAQSTADSDATEESVAVSQNVDLALGGCRPGPRRLPGAG